MVGSLAVTRPARRHMRRTPLVLSALALLAAAVPATAVAAPLSTDCAGLQNAMDTASSGDVITLTGALCPDSYSLPDVDMTLEGDGSSGFQPAGDQFNRSLTGGSANLVLRNLVFKGRADGDAGGGLTFTGSSDLTIDGSTFDGIAWTESGGGAHVSTRGGRPATPF